MNIRRLARCLDIAELRAAARRRAHRGVFDYIDGGADDEYTLRRNCEAFDDYELLFRVLVGVDAVDTSTTLLGESLSVPFFAAPSAGNRLFHTDGERAVAKAAGEAGLIYCLSTLATVSIEEIAKLTQGPKWFQCYVWKDRALVKEMLDRARAAGFSALILTVDFPVTGNRKRDPRIQYANLSEDTAAVSLAQFVAEQLNAGFSWRDAEWLLGEWNGKALIKGVVRQDDAQRALASGFNAIWVSNHGARQLDHSVAPIDVLEGIVQAVDGRAEVVMDGGIRHATDVLTALSCGARAVSFARPYLYGLAAAGYPGVRQAFKILATDLRRDMCLLGARNISEIDRSCVRHRTRV